MAIVLFRVDDRLIHGQVVVGWGRPLGVSRVVLVDDQVAASPWEQDLYRMAVTPDIEVEFVTIAQAALAPARLAVRRRTGPWCSPATSRPWPPSTAADPVTVHRINLGGIHHKAGRRERLPYLYLTDEEMMRLDALEAAGAAVSAQDLPTTAPVTLKAPGMTDLSGSSAILLIVWGTIVGLDLVSVPQAMLARPVVAGARRGMARGRRRGRAQGRRPVRAVRPRRAAGGGRSLPRLRSRHRGGGRAGRRLAVAVRGWASAPRSGS